MTIGFGRTISICGDRLFVKTIEELLRLLVHPLASHLAKMLADHLAKMLADIVRAIITAALAIDTYLLLNRGN